jgi:hypothetical protein
MASVGAFISITWSAPMSMSKLREIMQAEIKSLAQSTKAAFR